MRLPSSIQARVLALVFAASGLLWASVAGIVWVDTRHELDELLDAHLAQAASLLVAQQLPELEEEHGIDAPVLHRYAPKVAFQVFHEGRLALRSANAPSRPMLAPQGIGNNEFRTVPMETGSWRVFATRGAASDILVLVAEDVHGRASILAAVMRTTLGPLLLGLPLLALTLWWSVRQGLLPLNDIGRALASRKPDDFSPVARSDAPTEMQPMLDALDHLLSRISTLMESERRFIADASHELRTPLAAIRAHAQVALAEVDPRLRQHALEATIEGCDRAARLAEQLLALSRLDAGLDSRGQPVELGALARGVLAQVANGAIAKQQDLRFAALDEGPCVVCGDPALIGVLLRNLADNAIRYSPSKAMIVVSLQREADRIALVVENSGPMPSGQDLTRFGERFFRAPGTDGAGSGLGLSIVSRIAELHRAKLEFSRSGEWGGLRASVSFPRAPQRSA